MYIQVINQDPTKSKGEFEDTSQVEKYEMSAENYAKRTGRQVHVSSSCSGGDRY